MGELEYEKGSKERARDKGLLRKCYYCHRDYDPHIGCTNPECIQKRGEEEEKLRQAAKEREEKKSRLKEAFDREYDQASGLSFDAWVEGGMKVN